MNLLAHSRGPYCLLAFASPVRWTVPEKKKSLTREGIKKTKLEKQNSFDKTGERGWFC